MLREGQTADNWLMRRAEKTRAQWLLFRNRCGDDTEWIFPLMAISAHAAAYMRTRSIFGESAVLKEMERIQTAIEKEGLDVMAYGLLAAHGGVNNMSIPELYRFLAQPEGLLGSKQ